MPARKNDDTVGLQIASGWLLVGFWLASGWAVLAGPPSAMPVCMRTAFMESQLAAAGWGSSYGVLGRRCYFWRSRNPYSMRVFLSNQRQKLGGGHFGPSGAFRGTKPGRARDLATAAPHRNPPPAFGALAFGSIPASAITAILVCRSRYRRSHSGEQHRKPVLSNSFLQLAHGILKPAVVRFIGAPKRSPNMPA